MPELDHDERQPLIPGLSSTYPSSTSPLRILCSTFNAGYALPPSLWLNLAPSSSSGLHYDVIALGLQEVTSNLFFEDHDRLSSWESLIQAGFPSSSYRLVSTMAKGGMALFIILSTRLTLSTKRSAVVGTGMGWLYTFNKGAVATRIVLGDGRSVCFVNAHLSHGHVRASVRNREFRQVCERVVFGDERTRMWESHVVVFMGDLNYRLDIGTSWEGGGETLEGLIKGCNRLREPSSSSFLPLLTRDQLQNSLSLVPTLSRFWEPPITFAPTYKYIPYHPQNSLDPRRIPGYCDRILVWARGHVVEGEEGYGCEMGVMSSDHKPVVLAFVVNEVEGKKAEEEAEEEEADSGIRTFGTRPSSTSHDDPDRYWRFKLIMGLVSTSILVATYYVAIRVPLRIFWRSSRQDSSFLLRLFALATLVAILVAAILFAVRGHAVTHMQGLSEP